MGTKQMVRGLCLVITATKPVYGFKAPILFFGSRNIGPVPVSFVLVAVLCMWLITSKATDPLPKKLTRRRLFILKNDIKAA
jgi:ribose/xylose/arabinose/galactoside ABC-type transport system permease subunit